MKTRRQVPLLLAGLLAACAATVAGAEQGLVAAVDEGGVTRTPGAVATVAVAANAADTVATGVTTSIAVGAAAAATGESGAVAAPGGTHDSTTRPRQKLRFGGGPTCNCATGLGEKDIEAAERKRRLPSSPGAADRNEREN